LTNVPDNYTLFDEDAIYNISDIWVYNNTDIIITDSGEFRLKAACSEISAAKSNATTWAIPWGITLNKEVNQSTFFDFSAGVSCTGGECGNVSALLDPLSPEEGDYFYNIMANLANSDSDGSNCDPAAGTDYSCSNAKQQGQYISAYSKAYLSAKANNDNDNASLYYGIMVNLANTDSEAGDCYPAAGTDYSCTCPIPQGLIIEGYADAYLAAAEAGDTGNASRFLDIMNNLADTDPETECTPATGGSYVCGSDDPGAWEITRQSTIISGYARAYQAAINVDSQNAAKYLNIMNNLAHALDYSIWYSARPGCHGFAIKAYSDAYISAVEAGDENNASYYLAVMHNLANTDPSSGCSPVSGTSYSCGDYRYQGMMIFGYAKAYEAGCRR